MICDNTTGGNNVKFEIQTYNGGYNIYKVRLDMDEYISLTNCYFPFEIKPDTAGRNGSIQFAIGRNFSGEPQTFSFYGYRGASGTYRNQVLKTHTHENTAVGRFNMGYSTNNAVSGFVERFNFRNSGTADANNWNSTSDSRLKFNEVDLSGCLETIDKLQPKKYIKGDVVNGTLADQRHTETETGLIAQELETIDELKHIVSTPLKACSEEKPKSLRYTQLIAFLIGGIKELKARIEILENNQT